MKGVDAIAEILKRECTEFIACYPAQPLIDASAIAGIRPIMCRQEGENKPKLGQKRSLTW